MIDEQVEMRAIAQRALKQIRPPLDALSILDAALLKGAVARAEGTGKGIIVDVSGASLSAEGGAKPIGVVFDLAKLKFSEIEIFSAIITCNAGTLSHSVLRAEALNIPIIQSDASLFRSLLSNGVGRECFIHCTEGRAFLTFDNELIGKLDSIMELLRPDTISISFYRKIQRFRKLKIFCNIDSSRDLEKISDIFVDGIGMWRLENFVYGKSYNEYVLFCGEGAAKQKLERLRCDVRDEFQAILQQRVNESVIVRLPDFRLPTFEQDKCGEGRAGTSGGAALAGWAGQWDLRGVRVSVAAPRLYEVVLRALLEGAAAAFASSMTVMVPYVCSEREITNLKGRINKLARPSGVSIKVFANIETPRALFMAEKFASVSDGFSFGTNDLTECFYALSRDYGERSVVDPYLESGIFTSNPFTKLDREGLWPAIQDAVMRARRTNPSLKVGVSGACAQDVELHQLFRAAGVDYVSVGVGGARKVILEQAAMWLGVDDRVDSHVNE